MTNLLSEQDALNIRAKHARHRVTAMDHIHILNGDLCPLDMLKIPHLVV